MEILKTPSPEMLKLMSHESKEILYPRVKVCSTACIYYFIWNPGLYAAMPSTESTVTKLSSIHHRPKMVSKFLRTSPLWNHNETMRLTKQLLAMSAPWCIDLLKTNGILKVRSHEQSWMTNDHEWWWGPDSLRSPQNDSLRSPPQHTHLDHHFSTHLGHHRQQNCERVVTGGHSLGSPHTTDYIPLGWDMGRWGQPFRFWGLGHGNLGFRGGTWDNPLGFGGWDMGTWGLGVGLGDNPLGFGGWDMGTWGLGVNPFGFGGWDMGTWGLGVGLGV